MVKTFDEDFSYFQNELSFQKLFLPEISFKRIRWVFGSLVVAVFITGWVVVQVFDNKSGPFWIFILAGFFIVISIGLLYIRKMRRLLKRKGLPVPKCFCKWYAPALSDKRIGEALTIYKKVPSATLEQYIAIATGLVKEPLFDPFINIESFFKYLVIPLLSAAIALCVKYPSDYPLKNRYALAADIFQLVLLIFALTAGLYSFYLFFKSMYFDLIGRKKAQLKDYIFMLENILLLRS